MNHLTEDQREELRGALHAEKDALEEELAGYGRKVNGDWVGTASDVGAEADEVDEADKLEELSVNVPLVEKLEARHKELVAALQRMEAGTYGVTAAGDPIDFDRLQANPAATTIIG